jgi:hypothetical protein
MRSDRNWFARNPSRLYRARPCIAGELPEETSKQAISGQRFLSLIRRRADGGWVCQFIEFPDNVALVDSDEAIGVAFDECLKNGNTRVPLKYLRSKGPNWRAVVALAQWDHTSAGAAQ